MAAAPAPEEAVVEPNDAPPRPTGIAEVPVSAPSSVMSTPHVPQPSVPGSTVNMTFTRRQPAVQHYTAALNGAFTDAFATLCDDLSGLDSRLGDTEVRVYDSLPKLDHKTHNLARTVTGLVEHVNHLTEQVKLLQDGLRSAQEELLRADAGTDSAIIEERKERFSKYEVASKDNDNPTMQPIENVVDETDWQPLPNTPDVSYLSRSRLATPDLHPRDVAPQQVTATDTTGGGGEQEIAFVNNGQAMVDPQQQYQQQQLLLEQQQQQQQQLLLQQQQQQQQLQQQYQSSSAATATSLYSSAPTNNFNRVQSSELGANFTVPEDTSQAGKPDTEKALSDDGAAGAHRISRPQTAPHARLRPHSASMAANPLFIQARAMVTEARDRMAEAQLMVNNAMERILDSSNSADSAVIEETLDRLSRVEGVLFPFQSSAEARLQKLEEGGSKEEDMGDAGDGKPLLSDDGEPLVAGVDANGDPIYLRNCRITNAAQVKELADALMQPLKQQLQEQHTYVSQLAQGSLDELRERVERLEKSQQDAATHTSQTLADVSDVRETLDTQETVLEDTRQIVEQLLQAQEDQLSLQNKRAANLALASTLWAKFLELLESHMEELEPYKQKTGLGSVRLFQSIEDFLADAPSCIAGISQHVQHVQDASDEEKASVMVVLDTISSLARAISHRDQANVQNKPNVSSSFEIMLSAADAEELVAALNSAQEASLEVLAAVVSPALVKRQVEDADRIANDKLDGTELQRLRADVYEQLLPTLARKSDIKAMDEDKVGNETLENVSGELRQRAQQLETRLAAMEEAHEAAGRIDQSQLQEAMERVDNLRQTMSRLEGEVTLRAFHDEVARALKTLTSQLKRIGSNTVTHEAFASAMHDKADRDDIKRVLEAMGQIADVQMARDDSRVLASSSRCLSCHKPVALADLTGMIAQSNAGQSLDMERPRTSPSVQHITTSIDVHMSELPALTMPNPTSPTQRSASPPRSPGVRGERATSPGRTRGRSTSPVIDGSENRYSGHVPSQYGAGGAAAGGPGAGTGAGGRGSVGTGGRQLGHSQSQPLQPLAHHQSQQQQHAHQKGRGGTGGGSVEYAPVRAVSRYPRVMPSNAELMKASSMNSLPRADQAIAERVRHSAGGGGAGAPGTQVHPSSLSRGNASSRGGGGGGGGGGRVSRSGSAQGRGMSRE